MGFVEKFKDFFFKPSPSDTERVERWKEETDKKKNLTIEDFDRAKRTTKQKNKTLSSNF